MATTWKRSTKKPRLNPTEHPKLRLEPWPQSTTLPWTGRAANAPVLPGTCLYTSPWASAGCHFRMPLFMIQSVKQVAATCFTVQFPLKLSQEYKPHKRMQESWDSGAATQTMETLASHKNIEGKVLYCLSFSDISKHKPHVLLSCRSTERGACLLLK